MAGKPSTSGPAEDPSRKLRCAIYTRKSTEEGLNQEFNTLDAQRDAAEPYIRSQLHAGGRRLPRVMTMEDSRERTWNAPAWSPAIEAFEHDGKFEVLAELPGLKENDIKVEVTDGGLVIQGERKREHEERREGFLRSERSYGQFYRGIP